MMLFQINITEGPNFRQELVAWQCRKCGEVCAYYKWCRSCQIDSLIANFTNWNSGNEKLDDLIRDMQLSIYHPNNIVFEWISYNQFNNIKEIGKDDYATVYSAIWKDGPLYCNNEWTRKSNEKVTLKNIANEYLIEVKRYLWDYNIKRYGITQNPITKNYIMVLQESYCETCSNQYTAILRKWCQPCQIDSLKTNFKDWTSGNEMIDHFIQKRQLSTIHTTNLRFEWIPYNQFNNIKEISKSSFDTVYLAVWKDGPLCYNFGKLIRVSDKKVTLKCLDYLQNIENIEDEFLNKVERCLYYNTLIYGISQNPDTKDYIMVYLNSYCETCGKEYAFIQIEWCKHCQIDSLEANFKNWTSGNEIIDGFIQEMQLNINDLADVIFEWIPYNQFNYIKEISKDDVVYSAIWKDGPLHYYPDKKQLIRVSGEKVALKHNFKNINECLNKVKEYLIMKRLHAIFGISQNPDTKDYIIVVQNNYCETCGKEYAIIWNKWCEHCRVNSLKANFKNWTSGNKKIDDFIQEMQLKIKFNSIIFEWIPYDQLNNIKEIGKDGVAYLAIRKDDQLYYEKEWTGKINQVVVLKCSYNLQNNINEFLNEVKGYSTDKWSDNIKIYGISQNPNTKDYIMVLEYLEEKQCKNCFQKYTNIIVKWCKPCQIDSLKANFINWSSENEIIDNFIQEMQLNINGPAEAVFEWIPYNQFNNIIKIEKGGFSTVYSATWKDGPLCYVSDKEKLIRVPGRKVDLKCLHNSQNINEFLSKALKECDNDIKVYGISQNPSDNCIIVLEYAEEKQCKTCGSQYTNTKYKWCKQCQIDSLKANNITNWTSENEKIDNFIQEMQLKIDHSVNIVFEFIPYNQFSEIKEIGRGGFATVYSAIWKNGLLSYDSDKQEWIREPLKMVALKRLHNSQNITNEFLNEVKSYSIKKSSGILPIYGISQNPITKEYVMVLHYAKGGNFNDWMNKNYKGYFNWNKKIIALKDIIDGLKAIHQKQMVHRDFHTGNILFSFNYTSDKLYISDMGLCGEVGNIDEVNIYGVMPYIAPEVLRGNPYTQAADIYSFGMIMYFVATGSQPFDNIAHDHNLALDMCNGIRPEINDPEAPKCYIDLMKRCWDLNPNNRPDVREVYKLIELFIDLCNDIPLGYEMTEMQMQFKAAEEYRLANLFSIKNNQNTTHPQAIYISRLLNHFTKDLPKYDDNIVHSECLDCEI